MATKPLNNKPEKGWRALIVEDDESILESILFKLKKADISAIGATDGLEGIDILKKDRSFSVVLLDLRMPKGDGFSFLEEKNKDADISGIPVIVFTNLSQRQYLDHALALGVKGYLIKANHSLMDIVLELKNCVEGNKCSIDRA